MQQGGAAGVGAAANGRNYGHHARADVRAHCQVDALVEVDKSAENHCDNYRCQHRRRLDYGREQRAYQHQNQWVADARQKHFNRVERGKVVHCVRHCVQAHKQQAEASQNVAAQLQPLALAEHCHKNANARKRRENDGCRQAVAAEHTQRHNLRRNGRADVGAVDYRGRLRQRHYAHVDKTDDHNRHCARTLNGRRANRSNADAQPFALARFGKKAFQTMTARILKMGAHNIAGNQKNTDARQ